MSSRRLLKTVAATVAVLIAVTAAAFVYTRFDPASGAVPFPKCPFRMLTGLSCPGCGSQRALHSLLNGDISGALSYNALLLPAFLMIAALAVSEIMKRKYPRFHEALNSTTSLLIVLAVIILWTVVRNIYSI